MPRYVMLALLCGAGGILFVAVARSDFPGITRLSLFGVALFQIILATVGLKTWKSVSKRGDTLIVSDAFKTDLLSTGDVVMFVEGKSLLGKRVRVHLNRQTRFGWQFQFLPLNRSAVLQQHRPIPEIKRSF